MFHHETAQLHFPIHIHFNPVFNCSYLTSTYSVLLLSVLDLLSGLSFVSHHPLHPIVSSLIFQPVNSEMDWKASSGISATISVPSCPPLPEPPDPSVALSYCPRPPNTTKWVQPSPSSYTLPRAHPPALPKIFQPSVESGINRYFSSFMVRLFW